jgi:hypothetical protein
MELKDNSHQDIQSQTHIKSITNHPSEEHLIVNSNVNISEKSKRNAICE